MTNYARIVSNSAYLSTDFGRDYACKVFGLTVEDLEKIVGRYVKGKRKGQLKGLLRWQKVERGGWVRSNFGDGGYAVTPGKCYGHEIVDSWTTALLWDEDKKRAGYLPGETREQYAVRQEARREWSKARRKVHFTKIREKIAAMNDYQALARLYTKYQDRKDRRYNNIHWATAEIMEILFRRFMELGEAELDRRVAEKEAVK